nr:vesicle-associated membrane protein 3-like [Dasypus novemcinctus]
MSQEHFSPSYAVAADFQQVLGKYMMKYNKDQGDSAISILSHQVTNVKNVITQNIDTLLEKEERLNIFIDRADELQTAAKESQNTRKIPRIWRKYFKKIIVITVPIVLSIIIILLSTKVIPT